MKGLNKKELGICKLDDGFLSIEGVEDGIVTVSPNYGCHISIFANIIANCFKEQSNFADQICKFFKFEKLNGIQCIFSDVTFLVREADADPEKIISMWKTEMKKAGQL